jgi:hypothetical protein
MTTTVRVSCPCCNEDVVCPVACVQVFKGELDSRMLVLFQCPSCQEPRLRSADSKYLDRLLMAGVRLVDPPAEMGDPLRVSTKRLDMDEVLDFISHLKSVDDLVEVIVGGG